MTGGPTMKKLYVEGGKRTGTVPGVKVVRKGALGGTKAAAAKPCSRVNNLPGLMVKGPHKVG